MALESTTYINGLVATNPTGTDPKSQGDDHIRLVKSAIKNTFSGVTGEVTATHTELNALDGITATASELNILDGVTATSSELNILDGVTTTTAELNTLDGITATATELNLLDGITAIKDEDNMSSNSNTSLATQQSIKAYVDAQVAAATMTWTYVTRATLSTAGSYGSYSTVSIPSSVTSQNPSALIISVYLDTDDSSILNMYFKSSSVSERIMGFSISDNNSDDSSGSFNTFTVPYTSSVDIKWTRSGTQTAGYVYIDGYIS